ncbi:MAG: YjjG family noncanonical pyrimidine nucleotidase [Kurthia gibsonii]
MKTYHYLLFDLDDTLFDFQLAEKEALTRIMRELAPEDNQQQLIQTYRKINQRLWAQYERGEISKNTIIHTRFALTFKEFGKEIDGERAAKHYQQYLGEGTQLLDGALETLKLCKSLGYRMYALTNGLEKTQNSRLDGSGIRSYFDAIYISEQTGSQKPQTAFFDYVFAHSTEIIPTEALMIGDSLSSDIQGAQNIGIDSCWYNGANKEAAHQATYVVHNQKELHQLLAQVPVK